MTIRFHRSRSILAVALLAVLGLVLSLASCSSDGSDANGPTDDETTTTTAATINEDDPRLDLRGPTEIEGPITGGQYGVPYLAMPEGWEDQYGYTEDEYFISGDAVAYGAEEALGEDGTWNVQGTSATTPYKTRILVRHPADAADFNGTVVVEWLNVTAGRESDPDFGFMAEELLSQGYAYAAVSAQKIGVEPGGLGIEVPNVPPEALYPLKEWDPERYGGLSHPGDTWSYDIYTQATRALLDAGTDAPLGGLVPRHIIATGESQSSGRLATYANAIQPVTHLFDGIFIHSRGDGAADLGDEPTQKSPNPALIRDDLDIPVFQFETETDLESLGHISARQDDTGRLHTWEVAGTAHVDRSTLDYATLAGRRWTDASIDLSTSCGTINDGPQEPVVQTALAALNAWIVDGTPPPESPRFEVEGDAIVRDDDGLAVGAIRTPAVDAPISVLSGANTAPSVICSLFGSSVPFTPQQLADRYGDSETYVGQVEASANQAVTDGFLMGRHAEAMVESARQVEIG